MRINIVGSSGSGKSTFARRLSEVLDIPHIEMDALFWKPEWTESTNEEFFEKLEEVLKRESWILDGNYNRTRDIKWRNVDTVIWLDYSYFRTLLQSVKRTFGYAFHGTELWAGNRESFRNIFSRKSIILWMMQNYTKNRTRYLEMMNADEYRHIEFIHVRSRAQADAVIHRLTERYSQPA